MKIVTTTATITTRISPSPPQPLLLAGTGMLGVASPVTLVLDRLEIYLQQDPQNQALLADAFETALSAGASERALFHLRHGLALGDDPSAWQLREAHWLLSRHRWAEARERLLELERDLKPAGARWDTLASDLAYLDLRDGEAAAGVARLERRMDGTAGGFDPNLELVWLRLLHRDLQLERALTWVARMERAATLRPATAGVGSLVALDAGDYVASLRWSTLALDAPSAPIEAYVARASLALGEPNPTLARTLLETALKLNREDGRVWSAVGFAELLAQQLTPARAAFEQAVSLMPDHVGTWHGLGWTMLAQRDFGAARAAFDSALELDRNFAESHGGSAVALALAGDADGARSAVTVALRLDRGSLSARYADALLRGDARDPESLLRLADDLLAGKRTPLNSDLTTLLRSLARRPPRS